MNISLQYAFKQNADASYVRNNLARFGLEGIVADGEPDGDLALNAGVSLFKFLADLAVKDEELGISAVGVLYCGYDGIPNSDFLLPYYDITKTNYLIDAALRSPPDGSSGNSGNADMSMHLLLNTCMRWHIAVVESWRKLLILAAWCHHKRTCQSFNPKKFLVGNADPYGTLDGLDSNPHKPFLEIYRQAMRHAIAHGNAVYVLPDTLVVRESDRDNCEVLQSTYSMENPIEWAEKIIADAELLFHAVQIFFALVNSTTGSKSDKFVEMFKSARSNSVTAKICDAMDRDRDGNWGWDHKG